MQYGSIIILVGFVLLLVLMNRSNKKQERETQQMRNSLEVGDEITTIGGIIGEIVRIKEETVTIETGKDRTKIRILRSAVRSVDVYAAEKRGETRKPADSANNKNDSNNKNGKNNKDNSSKIETPKMKDYSSSETNETETDEN